MHSQEFTMPNVHETVKAYFDALVSRDAETLIAMMLPAAHYIKIGTDADEVIKGSKDITTYYQNHVASTEDFSIRIINLDVQERDDVAWFYTQQVWNLKWQGVQEEFVMRMTGVLEKVDDMWKFAQIHASIGVSAP
ncbi:nuclear transport factor 2 family protein [Candidatus Poribacteria bacterium]|nr:nuclear transport factor 2 family protein [Candidatus Poribacteria bacterium]MYB65309.1 nuclear transport factor 2 family protein [Candidatus Poribacteria bacterium]MYF54643.1 nuclear transport factor 2 family protein [Candidatus Poribacteria bacterium]MYI94749.1 nuclear transport factor 2 family protein [Candidatus Poribacteria bacterium]